MARSAVCSGGRLRIHRYVQSWSDRWPRGRGWHRTRARHFLALTPAVLAAPVTTGWQDVVALNGLSREPLVVRAGPHASARGEQVRGDATTTRVTRRTPLVRPQPPSRREPVERVLSGAVRPVKWARCGPQRSRSKTDVRRSMPVFTLNRERVPLTFQAGYAGSIPVARSTEKPLTQQGFSRARGRPFVVERASRGPNGDVDTTPPGQHQPGNLARHRGRVQPVPVRSDPPDRTTYDDANPPVTSLTVPWRALCHAR